MIECANIQQEAEELFLSLQNCTSLKAEQLQTMVNLIISLNACKCDCSGEVPTEPGTLQIISFQFDNVTDDINNINLLTDQFLMDNGTIEAESSLITGKNITMTKIGRFGFVIKNSTENPYFIFDILNNNITTNSFDYVFDNGISYYITKSFVTPSDIFFRFTNQ